MKECDGDSSPCDVRKAAVVAFNVGSTGRESLRARARIWDARQRWLEEVLDRLLASPRYGPHGSDRPRPPASHGIYLFAEAGQALYVGRTSRTERARRAGRPGFSSFRSRLAAHVNGSSTPGSAPFAWRLALETCDARGVPRPRIRDEWADDPRRVEFFAAAKVRIRAMELLVAEIDRDDGVGTTLAELYAHVMLETRHNDFSTA